LTPELFQNGENSDYDLEQYLNSTAIDLQYSYLVA